MENDKKSTRNDCEVRKPSVKQESPEQTKGRMKEKHGALQPRLTSEFEERNTTQSQELMELKSKDLENASDWNVWSLHWDSVPTHVEQIRTSLKDLDDKLDEKTLLCPKATCLIR